MTKIQFFIILFFVITAILFAMSLWPVHAMSFWTPWEKMRILQALGAAI